MHRYVAIGDSFTEGLDDPRGDGTYRGWADRVAEVLAESDPGLAYANLAVRGKRLEHVRDVQLPVALAARPDLVTVAAGGNDILGVRVGVPELARELHGVLEQLVASGADVLVLTGFDARGRVPLGRVFAARAAAYNAQIAVSAEQLGVRCVDLWGMRELYRDVMWAPDRLHLSPQGHALVAAEVLRELGVERPYAAGPDREPLSRLAALQADATWARVHLAPWLGRRLRGRSSGDLVDPKRPQLAPVVPAPRVEHQGCDA